MKIKYHLLFGFVGLGLGVGLHFAFADPNVPTGGGSSGGGGGGSVTQGTVPWVDDITQWANTVLGAATAWGTAPSGNVPGVNANVLALPALPAGTNSIGTIAKPVGTSAWSASGSVTIGTSGTLLIAARTGVPGTGRSAVVVTNQSSYYGCIGPTSSVAISGTICTAGVLLPPGAGRTLDTQAAVYGVLTTSGPMDATETY